MKNKRAVWIVMSCLAAALGWGTAAAAAEEPARDATLRLVNGDFVTGSLGDSATPDVMNWQSPAFAEPLAFPVGNVASVQFAVGLEQTQPTGAYCVELAGGDQLFGDLVGLSDKELVLDVQRLGRLTIDRKYIRRVLSWGDGAKVLYQGPNGLAGWDRAGEWAEEGGQLITTTENAFLHRDLGLPSQAGIELEVSWKNSADFVIAFGVDTSPQNIKQAFRIEVWEQDLVLMRETDEDVDVTSLMKLKPGKGSLHLQVYLDQDESRIYAFTADGRRIKELEVSLSGGPAFTYTGLRVLNKRGDLRLERLRVTEWNGEAPHDVEGQTSRVHLANGSTVGGRVESYDAAARQFIVTTDDKPVRIDARQVVSFTMSGESPEVPRSIYAIFPDNNRVSGSVVKIEKGNMFLKCAGIAEELTFPVSQLQSLATAGLKSPTYADTEQIKKRIEQREGRLEIGGLRLHGRLVDARAADGTCLVFHPREGTSNVPIREGVSGRMVYRDPPPPQPHQPVQRRARVIRQRKGFWGNVMENLSTGNSSVAGVKNLSGRAIHLITGDVIPANVTQIDERGVHFESTMTDAKFVPNEKVKAVDFVKAQSTIRFSKEKRDRLLTLPRMQKHNPPTHLIRSIKGDYLRARILDMDDEYLTVEVRLETKQIPRENISRIIWLHGDDLDVETADGGESPAPPAAAKLVQALRSDGTRLTFAPSEVGPASISGVSDVLGQCQVEFKIIDQLIFGNAIEEAASKLTYHQWKLKHAVEPRYLSASGAENNGLESPLVGQAAPDFTLKLLDGGEFHLADHQGTIVVLDFWATWCGPCMQALPQEVGVAHEFEGQQVQFVAVNLEEAPERIRDTLERLKLNPQVALDQDGAVADKYSATAIPQTVIIDRDGKIARLFIGGGGQIGETLRKALQEVVSGKPPAGEADANPPDGEATSADPPVADPPVADDDSQQ